MRTQNTPDDHMLVTVEPGDTIDGTVYTGREFTERIVLEGNGVWSHNDLLRLACEASTKRARHERAPVHELTDSFVGHMTVNNIVSAATARAIKLRYNNFEAVYESAKVGMEALHEEYHSGEMDVCGSDVCRMWVEAFAAVRTHDAQEAGWART